MSHAATKWAFDQPEQHRDMKPSEWAVLMVLADCHNPVNGCFPSQDYICSKTNLGERAVRDQLARLKQRGLIDWDAAREGGRRGSNRYRLGFEPDFQPAKSAGSSEEDPTGENAPDQPAESDSTNRQNLPPNPVREPVKEPEREGAGARDEQETADADDPKKFEARVKRLADRLDWPGWANSSTAWAVSQFAKLTDAERAEAERCAEAYMRHCGRKALSIGVYFAERKWRDVPDDVLNPPPATTLDAKPFGPLWSGAALRELISPPQPSPPPTSAFLRDLLARDDEQGQAERLKRQATWGWPKVTAWYRQAESRKGFALPAHEAWLSSLMEPVPVGSAAFGEWQREYERRGWPWIPDPGGQKVVYFPRGGPAGLTEFEDALRRGGQEAVSGAAANGEAGQGEAGREAAE